MNKILLVSGSRTIKDKDFVFKCLNWAYSTLKFDTILHGNAKGVDKLAGLYAKIYGFHVIEKDAKWEVYGRSAGSIRNTEMVTLCDKGIAIIKNNSPGTKHCISELMKKNKLLRVFKYNEK